MRRLISWGLLFCFLLAGCTAGSEGSVPAEWETETEHTAPYRFAVGYSGSGYTEALQQWKELVAEDTQNNVELLLYGDNVLGEGKEMLQAVQRGTLSIMASSTSVHTQVVPEASVLDIPACFPEYSQAFRIYEGAFFETLNQYYQEQGLELLLLRTGEPWIISSVEPVTSLEQLKNFRLRTSGSAYHNRLYDFLGVQCIEDVGLSGLAYILDENGVDGIETTYTILRSQELLDIQPYALRGPMFVMSSAIVMNYDVFHAMPQEYQDSLKGRLREILAQRQNEASTQSEDRIHIQDLDQRDQELLRQLAAPIRDEILAAVDDALAQALLEENKTSP